MDSGSGDCGPMEKLNKIPRIYYLTWGLEKSNSFAFFSRFGRISPSSWIHQCGSTIQHNNSLKTGVLNY